MCVCVFDGHFLTEPDFCMDRDLTSKFNSDYADLTDGKIAREAMSST